jgi:hypothetical protein
LAGWGIASGRQHDPGPDDLALLGGRPAQPALQHPPLAGGQGDRKRAGSAHEWLTTSSPAGVVAAPTLTATASSRLARSSVVERLACSTTTAAADGQQNIQIAGRLGVAVNTVSKWRKRFVEEGLSGLGDRKRPGRPRRFPLGSGGGGQGDRL